MAITKRWSRPITVDGQSFRWLVRQKPSYQHSYGDGRMTLAVEHSGGGSVMVVTLPQPHPDSIDSWASGEETVPVLPSDVARLIRAGQAAGWNPTEPGNQFRFTAPAV